MSNTKYLQNYKKQRSEKGLCYDCGEPADKIRCNKCIDRARLQRIARTVARKLAGLCKLCSKRLDRGGSRCSICATKLMSDHSTKTRYRKSRYEAKRRDLDWLLSYVEYDGLISDMLCHYCVCTIDNQYGIGLDRLDNTKGYIIDNVVRCCSVCNTAKSDFFTPDEMKMLGATIKTIRSLRSSKSAHHPN
jgi:hypothetical protein